MSNRLSLGGYDEDFYAEFESVTATILSDTCREYDLIVSTTEEDPYPRSTWLEIVAKDAGGKKVEVSLYAARDGDNVMLYLSHPSLSGQYNETPIALLDTIDSESNGVVLHSSEIPF